MDSNIDPTCRFCLEEEETTWHLAAECPALWQNRRDIFYEYIGLDIPPKWNPHQIILFMDSLLGQVDVGRDILLRGEDSENIDQGEY